MTLVIEDLDEDLLSFAQRLTTVAGDAIHQVRRGSAANLRPDLEALQADLTDLLAKYPKDEA